MLAGVQLAPLLLGVVLVAAGVWLFVRRVPARRALARAEDDGYRRASLLNRERVDAVLAAQEPAGDQPEDRLRIVLFAFLLVLAGALAITAGLG